MHNKSDKPTQSDVPFSLEVIIIVLSLQKCSFKILLIIILFFLFRGNALDSVNDTPSNDEDEPEMFKRSPWF